jgi:hypothetical protein
MLLEMADQAVRGLFRHLPARGELGGSRALRRRRLEDVEVGCADLVVAGLGERVEHARTNLGERDSEQRRDQGVGQVVAVV